MASLMYRGNREVLAELEAMEDQEVIEAATLQTLTAQVKGRVAGTQMDQLMVLQRGHLHRTAVSDPLIRLVMALRQFRRVQFMEIPFLYHFSEDLEAEEQLIVLLISTVAVAVAAQF